MAADKKTLELQIRIAADNAQKIVQSLSAEFKTLAARAKDVNTSGTKDTFSRLETEAKKAATSFKLFGTSAAEVRTMQNQLKAGALDLAANGFAPESKEIQQLIAEYKRLGKEAETLDSANDRNISSFADLKSALANTAQAAAAVKALSVTKDFVSFAAHTADTFQTARNEFGTLLGDMQAGAGLFDSIIKPFNDFTPFDLETTQQATKVLMAAKVPISDLTSKLTMFGDISQGNAQKFQSFINAFSKGTAKGKADMEVLNVYIDQGIPILDELAKNAGVTSAEIVDMASKGLISAEQFEAALASMAAQGGQYYGGMELGARSLAAMQAGLEEAVNSLAASFGEIFLPALIETVGVLTSMVNVINDSPFIKGLLAAALVAITAYLAAMAIKAGIAFMAQMKLNLAVGALNPAVMAATIAVAALAGGITAYSAVQKKATEETNAAALALKEADQNAKGYIESLKKMSNVEIGFSTQALSIELVSLEKSLSRAKKELAKTPQRNIDIVDIGGDTMTIDNGENTRYQELIEKVNNLNSAIETTKQKIQAAQNQITANNLDAAVQKGNSLLKQRDALYKKTAQYQEEELIAQLEFAKSLASTKVTNADGTKSGLNADKTAAIVAYAQQELDNFYAKNKKSAEDFGREWSDKLTSGVVAIMRERDKSIEMLNKKAQAAYGETYSQQKEYEDELGALRAYYQQKITEQEKQDIITAHQLKLQLAKDEFEYKQELARSQIESGSGSIETYGAYAVNAAGAAVADTQIGQTGMGVDPVTMLIDSLLGAVMEIESVTKVLNTFGTIANAVVAVIEPIVNDIFEPIADLLEEIGGILGDVLAPILGVVAAVIKPLSGILKILMIPLKALGEAFKWLYNSVIRPIGNCFIDMVNAVIGALNHIPFVDIDKIDRLSDIGDTAEDIAESIAKKQEEIEKMYERQKDKVNDLLDAQIDSLKSQYELGLISRDEYNAQTDKYQEEADAKLLEINETMAAALAQIELNTYKALDSSQQQQIADSRKSYADTLSSSWGDSAGVLGSIAGSVVGTVADVASAAWDGAKTVVSNVGSALSKVGKGIASFFGFDVGTPSVPADMPAFVHQGEGIIPRTFNDAIKSGEYALVGGKTSGTDTGTVIQVNLTVGGSVVTERQIVDIVYDGIAAAIQGGTKAPLPEAA